MRTGLEYDSTRHCEAGLEVAPSSDPIATNPDHSGPETAPSTGLIVARPDYSDIEVVTDKTSYLEKHDSKPRRIWGLRKTTFWLSLILAVILIAGAVGGGVGGSLAGKDNKANDGNPKSTSSPTHPATVSTGSRTTSVTTSAVTSGTTGIAGLSCNDTITTTSNGVRYKEFCGMDWPVGFSNLHGSGTVEDVQDVTTYTFQSCMNACDAYNIKYPGACNALTYNADLTSSLAFSGGNCILKSSQANTNVSAGSLVASAAIVK